MALGLPRFGETGSSRKDLKTRIDPCSQSHSPVSECVAA